eukprot:350446-Chlamydomonas_euryale.AAC.1
MLGPSFSSRCSCGPAAPGAYARLDVGAARSVLGPAAAAALEATSGTDYLLRTDLVGSMALTCAPPDANETGGAGGLPSWDLYPLYDFAWTGEEGLSRRRTQGRPRRGAGALPAPAPRLRDRGCAQDGPRLAWLQRAGHCARWPARGSVPPANSWAWTHAVPVQFPPFGCRPPPCPPRPTASPGPFPLPAQPALPSRPLCGQSVHTIRSSHRLAPTLPPPPNQQLPNLHRGPPFFGAQSAPLFPTATPWYRCSTRPATTSSRSAAPPKVRRSSQRAAMRTSAASRSTPTAGSSQHCSRSRRGCGGHATPAAASSSRRPRFLGACCRSRAGR